VRFGHGHARSRGTVGGGGRIPFAGRVGTEVVKGAAAKPQSAGPRKCFVLGRRTLRHRLLCRTPAEHNEAVAIGFELIVVAGPLIGKLLILLPGAIHPVTSRNYHFRLIEKQFDEEGAPVGWSGTLVER